MSSFPFPLPDADRESLRCELLRRAAVEYESVEHWQDAADCWDERGDLKRAAALYLRAGDLGRAAATLLSAGRYEEALERYLAWEGTLPAAALGSRVRCLLGQSACRVLADPSRRSERESRSAYCRARSLISEAASGLQAVACWLALGQHGAQIRRYDLVQEGYEEALATCENNRHAQRTEICRSYLEAVRDFGDRLLTRELEQRLAELEDGEPEPKPGDLWVDPALGMEFSYIPPGKFQMGSPEDEEGRWEDETPHRVTLTKGYWLGRTAVTQGQYERFVRSVGYAADEDWKRSGGERHPVAYVSWLDAQAFCNWLSGTSREEFRLPTEAEWERAARAGTTGARYAEPLDHIGWYDGNSGGHTHPVGEKAPNGWDLHDMLGNVYEWVEDAVDRLSESSTYQDDVVDPLCQRGSFRVFRGGGCFGAARYCRAAYRNAFAPEDRNAIVGFRVLRTVPSTL